MHAQYRDRCELGLRLLSIAISLSICQVSAEETMRPVEHINRQSTSATVSGATVASNAIKDTQGRTRYIVDLVEEAKGRPDRFIDAESKIAWHRSSATRLIDSIARSRGIEVFASTSLVGTTFTAYLTDQQLALLSRDPRVSQITEDKYLSTSALWNSTVDANGQVRPWGLHAMGLSNAGPSNGSAAVYVLDTGVELHSDLMGLAPANRLTALTLTGSGDPVNPTGCYSHATHVAGIIGAADNGGGVVGALPNVKLISIALGDTNSASNTCSTGSSASAFVAGLDKIYQQVLQSGRTAIVNISLNDDLGTRSFASTGAVGRRMKVLATPSFLDGGYPGALIVQSAGNQGASEVAGNCTHAYDATSTYDGIIVVGGLDENGQAVRPMLNNGGYPNLLDLVGENGSNTGSCVEVWAPSQRIKSTWTGGSYEFLSGTSMAAPYVSGLAARLLETDSYIATSIDLEVAVRAHLTTITGSGLALPVLQATSYTARPTIEIADGTNRSFVGPVNISKFPDEVQLAYQAVGTSTSPTPCIVYATKNGAYLSFLPAPASGTLSVAGFERGNYSWTVTCVSPQGTQTSVVANAFLKRRVAFVRWWAYTTSTQYSWQTINDGQSVSWSVSNNDAFVQKYDSSDADSCELSTYGMPYGPGNTVSPRLWYSGAGYPTNLEFVPLHLGDPVLAPPPLGPFSGYRWDLTCRNNDLDSKSTTMYGTKQF